MIDALQDPQDQLNALRLAYRQQLPSQIEQIETIWHQLLLSLEERGTEGAEEQGCGDVETPPGAGENQEHQRLSTSDVHPLSSSPNPPQSLLEAAGSPLETLHHLMHRLAGSSGTFGLLGLGNAARTLELVFKAILDSGKLPTAEEQAQICMLVGGLKQAMTVEDTFVLDLNLPPPQSQEPWLENRLIFLVEDDPHLSQDLALQISCFGYQVRTFDQIAELEEAIAQTPPAAAIVDVVFPEDSLAGPKTITAIQQHREQPLPVLFISARNDLMARLQAVRAGGKAYFPKPINIGELIDALDLLTVPQIPEPYRILIVDDDAPLAFFYGWTLEQAGMTAVVVTDPLQVMAPLIEFRPDLILIDMYMPGCNGVELAAVIRQQPAYVGIPIVFLSMETDVNKQLAAIQLGGDDFLTKPIQPNHLIASVMPRVQRSRLLRSVMVRDSLTGLLNHTTIKEQLSIEVERGQRENTNIAFAMIDIDDFKSVNDSYGHLTGDRVLKSLSRLLQQRLRKTDITGRYGGEEFAAILPNTDGATAVKVLNRIREGFAQVRQQSDGAEFSVTFSCGIAVFPNVDEATQLNEAADKALYEAKRRGRNQVILAM
ncbi:diguanylate cyclase [Coleofasciculus sp. H7-2]|uniref:diguanylate cyclase n=1 Tax=Coleofasciculus sp. H7-2 TaxID=3351545 RepID=UPI003670F417